MISRLLAGFAWGLLWLGVLLAGIWLTSRGLHLGLMLCAGAVLALLAAIDEVAA
jgi:hypothetical protein